MLNQTLIPMPSPSLPEVPSLSALDLFRHGQAEPGFYALPGDRRLSAWVLERLVGLLAEDAQQTPSEVRFPPGLGKKEPRVVGPLYWIDSGNMFDPYFVARIAAQKQLDPQRVLQLIQVARPFTAFQFQRMLRSVPAPASWCSMPDRNPAKKMEWQWTPLVILSDVMNLFCDDEAKDADLQRAFKDFLVGVSELKKRAVVVGLCSGGPATPAQQYFYRRVMSHAHVLGSFRPTPILKTSIPAETLSWPKAGNDGW